MDRWREQYQSAKDNETPFQDILGFECRYKDYHQQDDHRQLRGQRSAAPEIDKQVVDGTIVRHGPTKVEDPVYQTGQVVPEKEAWKYQGRTDPKRFCGWFPQKE